MIEKEKIEAQDIENDKLLKGYIDTIFNIWRIGKDAKLNYKENKEKLNYINTILDDHISLLEDIDYLFSNLNKIHNTNYHFDNHFDLDEYSQKVRNQQKSLEKTLKPLKNLSKKYDRTLKILQKNGFQILEFDGKKFNDGMSIKVLGYDSKHDIEDDIIIETVKPTIFFNNKEYLKGEVIVSKKPDNL